jgi:DNA-binding transcriptional regulator LsrR (DeoR family)
MSLENNGADLAVHVAWLSYVGGYTQAEIAKRLTLSRAKVHRLISEAHASGYVHVFIDRSPHRLIALEDQIAARFGLTTCIVTPDVDETPSPHGSLAALGSAAARLLNNRLARGDVHAIGVSWGRSLAEMARQFPRQVRPDLAVVSIMGSLTRQSAINPLDVVHRLTDATGAQGFFLPVPFIADSVQDKEVLTAQRSVRFGIERARETELCLVGIGTISAEQPMFVESMGLLNRDKVAALRGVGAAGELVGHFLGHDGALLDIDINQQTIGLSMDELHTRETIAVAGGQEKVSAIRAVLRSGVLDGLVTDENAAAELCEGTRDAA